MGAPGRSRLTSWMVEGADMVVLEMHAAKAEAEGFLEEPGEFVGGFGGGDTFGADVGDAVAVGIGAGKMGIGGEVGSEAIGCA